MLNQVQSGPRDGAPIVFLHGAGYDGRMWAEVIAQMPECRCTALDLPGHGESRATPFDGFDAAADAVAACVKDRSDGPVTLVGVSLGAYIGYRCLARHPGLARRAVLSGLQDRPVLTGPMLRATMRLAAASLQVRTLRERAAGNMGFANLSVASAPDGGPNASVRTMWQAARCAHDFDAHADFDRIRTPTLFLAGEKEHPAILDALGIFRDGITGAEARMIPGYGQGWCAEQPGVLAQAVSCWRRGNALPQVFRRVAPAAGV